MTATGAEDLVRTIASRVGLHENDPDRIDLICANLKREYILEDWQLAALDSQQWKELGAPMGLAAAIRTLATAAAAIESSSPASSSSSVGAVASTREDLQSLASSAAFLASEQSSEGAAVAEKKQATIQKIRNRISLADRIRNSSAATMTGHIRSSRDTDTWDISGSLKEEPREGTADEESALPRQNEVSVSKDKKHLHKVSNLESSPSSAFAMLQAYREYQSIEDNKSPKFFGPRPFSMSLSFQRAMIHSKSGAELKAHTVFIMELNVLAAALFLGAGVELWGSFPMDAVMDVSPVDGATPYVPKNLALVFHFVAAANLIVQLASTAGWIWTIHASAAVHPNKFHEFLVQTQYAFDRLHKFTEVGQIHVIVVIALLLAGHVASVSSNVILRNIVYYVPVVATVLGCRFVHTLSSYVGRVAYHGLLLMGNDPEQVVADVLEKDASDLPVEGEGHVAAQAEARIAKSFCRHNLLSEGGVLGAYCKARMAPNDDEAERYSLLDVILPDVAGTPNISHDVSNGEDRK